MNRYRTSATRFAGVAALLLLSILPLAAKGRSVPIVPVNGTTAVILLGDKELEYYILNKNAPLRIQLDGPGKLTVISRLRIPPGRSGGESYTIRIAEGVNVIKAQSTQTDKSDGTFKGTDDRAGKSRKFSMNVPDGTATYEVRLEDTPLAAGVKFSLVPDKQRTKLVAVEPLSYERIVMMTVNENRLAYYVASREHPVQLRVVGPTSVKMNLRLNYDVAMKGEQKFSVLVTEGKQLVVQRPLETTKSTGLQYEEWKEVVPGKPNDILFDVPKGEHSYRILLGESSAKSVSLRFSVPQSDLSNEK